MFFDILWHIILAFMVAIWVSEMIEIVIALTLAPKFGFRCNQVSLFWLKFSYRNGKWNCGIEKFSIAFQHLLVRDLSKMREADEENEKKKEKNYYILLYSILIVSGIVILFLCRDVVVDLLHWKFTNLLEIFLGSFSIAMLLYNIIKLLGMVYFWKVKMKQMYGYISFLTDKMRRGEQIETFALKPVEELPYEKVTIREKISYYPIYLLYLSSLGKTEEMRGPIYEMTEYFMHAEFLLSDMLQYYWLIYYYSRYEVNVMYADMFLQRVSSVIQKDPDANAKRVLGYYYYGVKRDVAKARQCVREGLACADHFSIPGSEREMERKLLLELDEILMREV